jgi:hypothetical protein
MSVLWIVECLDDQMCAFNALGQAVADDLDAGYMIANSYNGTKESIIANWPYLFNLCSV